MPKQTPVIRPNQVWADNDERMAGRTLRVEEIDGGKAVCVILTNATTVQHELDRRGGRSSRVQDTRGRTTRISLSRFRPTSSGYQLVEDAPEQGPAEGGGRPARRGVRLLGPLLP
jgi:hypothetical protein